MPYHEFASIALALAIASVGHAQTLTTMISNGPPSNRVDIVFIGDGYLSAQLETLYPQHVQAQINYLFSGSAVPFPRYQHFFNVHRVNVASNQTGADQPPLNIFRDTALDASYWYDGVTERLLYFSNSKANAAVNTALAGTGITADMRFGTVNDSKYGGGGGNWAVYAGANSSAADIALHEVGHSFAGLADEYFTNGTTYTGPEPGEPNATRSPTTGKWDRWLGYDDPQTNIGPVGYYEGARYFQFGLYRPSQNSEMRSLFRPFDAISRERFISRIYDRVDPLDSWQDNGSTLVNPVAISVQTVDPAVIGVNWTLDGVALGDAGETLELQSLRIAGAHTIEARAYDLVLDHAFSGDSLDWWRLPDTNKLQQTVSWQIFLTAGDFNDDGVWTCDDVDALVADVAAGTQSPRFDLNDDTLVNLDDVSVWLSLAGSANLDSGQPYLFGDANLDGAVDGSDFIAWNASKFTNQPAWCHGDFNADGLVDGQDFVLWNANKFTSSLRAAAVPEPQLTAALWIVWYGLSGVRRQVAGRTPRCEVFFTSPRRGRGRFSSNWWGLPSRAI